VPTERANTLSCSKSLDPLNQLQIPTKILLLEAGHAAAPIVVSKVIKAGDFPAIAPTVSSIGVFASTRCW